MSYRNYIAYTTINSGDTLSAAFDIRGFHAVALSVPGVTSCEMYLQGSFGEAITDAAYRDVYATDGSSMWAFACAAGSAAVVLSDTVHAFPFLRLRSSVTQAATNVATIVIIGKQ